MKIDDILLALAAKGQASDSQRLAMVWIDRPGRGCFVRASDIFKIESNGPGEPGSLVTVVHPSGKTEMLRDTRAAKTVKSATERAQRDSVELVWKQVGRELSAGDQAGKA